MKGKFLGRAGGLQPLPAFKFTGEITGGATGGRRDGQLRKTGERSPVAIVLVQHHGRVTGSCSRVPQAYIAARHRSPSPAQSLGSLSWCGRTSPLQ